MQVYHLPSDALAQSVCFSLPSNDGTEELLVIPQGCTEIPKHFDGFVYLPWDASDILTAPITQDTLIPESLAAEFPENPLIISSQICGGTLKNRLQEALDQYGDRIFLLIEPMRHLLPLPCPNAEPNEISETEGQIIRKERTQFYSDEFCCNYCIDPAERHIHFFDTDATIKMKLELAESLGVRHILLLPV